MNQDMIEIDYKELFLRAYRLLLRHHFVTRAEDWGKLCRVCKESAEEVEGVLYVGNHLIESAQSKEPPRDG